MATYFSDSNTQRDDETMLYSKEPLPSSYSEASITPGNLMMYTSYASSSGRSFSDTFAGNSEQPISNPSQQDVLSNSGGPRIGFSDFSTWRNGRNDAALMQPTGDATDVVLQQGQGLSLSLGPHVTPGFHDPHLGFSSFLGPNQLISSEGNGGNVSFGDNGGSRVYQSRILEGIAEMSTSSFGISSIASTISNSKYLNTAQELLDEIVHVRIALKKHNSKKELANGIKEFNGGSKDGSLDSSATGTGNAQDANKNELSAAEKQDLQNKMSKLSSMLDEVHHRYKQYYNQMQIVVSSFNVVAGPGAAKPYTALALQTISRHFRSLRDAINTHIQITRKSLGEQDATSNGKGVTISRLRYVDQRLKQQRALQQLGMMQQHAWRPQRGLPENAVSVLRAWLFEHFLHPYPKDSEKIVLARQVGLTRSQVSNWFINARVRLWKPMVEEMYKEETGDAEMDSTSSAEMVTKATESDTKVSEEDLQQTGTSTAMEHQNFFDSKFDHRTDLEIGNLNRNATFQNITHGETQNSYEVGRIREDQNSYAYEMSEIERFGNGNGNGVSLTLGLQRCEGGNIPVSIGNHHSFVTTREDDVYDEITPSSIMPETTEFDRIDTSNQHNKYSSSRYFHDFVA